MKKFDLEKALNGAKLITRDGQEVKNFRKREENDGYRYNRSEFPYSAVVYDSVEVYTDRGRQLSNSVKSNYDLFLADDEQPANKQKIYLSGAITGMSEIHLERSFGFFEKKFKELGYEVVNPLNNGLTTEESWADHMIADLEILKGCDIIATMDDWAKSDGAQIEVRFAEKINIRVVDAEDFITEITNKNNQRNETRRNNKRNRKLLGGRY